MIPWGLPYRRTPLPARKPFIAQGLNTQPKLQPSFNKTILLRSYFFLAGFSCPVNNLKLLTRSLTTHIGMAVTSEITRNFFHSTDSFKFTIHFVLLRLPCTQKRKKLTDRSCLNDNYLINRAPSRLSHFVPKELAGVAGGNVESARLLSFGGGAAIQKKEWERGVFLEASPLVAAPPPNLTRLVHNTASYASY